MHTGMPGLDPLATPKDGIRLSPPPLPPAPDSQDLVVGWLPRKMRAESLDIQSMGTEQMF